MKRILVVLASAAFALTACTSGTTDTVQSSQSGSATYSSTVKIAGLNVSVFDGTEFLQSGSSASFGKLQMSITPTNPSGGSIDLTKLQVDVVDKEGKVHRQRLDDSAIEPGDANVYYLDSEVPFSDVSKVIISDNGSSYTFTNK